MTSSSISIRGARQNNLKNIDVEVPLGKMTVVCGPSGSGKSSLAFQTLYAEGQRRYIESLSNYSKQFLNKAPKPLLDDIENIPPAVSIEQKNSVKSSRSTVGTTTEVVDFLRLIYEKLGHAYCPNHNEPVEAYSPSSSAERILKEWDGQRGYVLSFVPKEDRLFKDKKLREAIIALGFSKILVEKKGKFEIIDFNEDAKASAPKTDFYIVIDRLAFSKEDQGRLVDSLSQAFQISLRFSSKISYPQATVMTTEFSKLKFSEETSCVHCDFTFPRIQSSLFSFNSPVGACPECKGFGNILDLDEGKIIPNPEMTLNQGAIAPFAMPSAAYDRREMRKFCTKAKIDMDTPWSKLPDKQRKLLWEGTKEFYGVRGLFEYLETKKYKMHIRVFLSRFKSPFTCKTCKGSRLRPEALQVLINKKNIFELNSMTVSDLHKFLKGLSLTPSEQKICAEPLRQLLSRLQFLEDVGVGYLTMDRPTRTLSGGEYQRLSLANQLGMGLSQTLYVLDEPTVGLHPRDNDRLIEILKQLKDLGNTLVVVEHDHDVIQNAEHIIEMGPGSGHLGGTVLFEGDQDQFYKSDKSNTVKYLLPQKKWAPLRTPRPVDLKDFKYRLQMTGCKGNNLKKVDLTVPLNRLVTVTGVSGSGKSTLITQTLYPAIARQLGVEFIPGETYKTLDGVELVKDVVLIDQSSVGKTARSNPMTYLKIYDAIRTVMSSTDDAKERGYTAGTFSLNVDGGRCPTCKGLGYEIVDMVFMDDVEVICETCDGKRFRPELLEIQYKGRNIHDILNMTVAEAMDFFVSYPNIRKPLSLLKEVGLDYLRIGQSSNSLSGGESQRLKLARELSQSRQKSTLYILDEPTTGLHFREVHLLIKVLDRLVESGASVVVIEHNLDVIENSDFVIDMGPDAGSRGGEIVTQGTPQEIMQNKKSLTGKYLKKYRGTT